VKRWKRQPSEVARRVVGLQTDEVLSGTFQEPTGNGHNPCEVQVLAAVTNHWCYTGPLQRQAVKIDELAADIKRVAQKLGVAKLGRSTYLQNNSGRFSMYDVYDDGHTWEEHCARAGILTKTVEPVPDEVYFSRLRIAIERLGRFPKTSERKRFNLNFTKRRWPTLDAFRRDAVARGIILVTPERESSENGKAVTVTTTVNASPPQLPSKEKTIRAVPPIPKITRRQKWERTGIDGFPYAPQDELGVVAIFAILCAKGIIPWQITELNGGKGIDGTCYDHEKNCDIRVEVKRILSQHSWNHSLDDLDCVVCWESRWADFPKQVIELKRLIHGEP
jgi:hypothetical protein